MNPSFYLIAAIVLIKIMLHGYTPQTSHSLVPYTLENLALTLWIAPWIWRQAFAPLNTISLKISRGFWALPLCGFLLVNMWFSPPLQTLATFNLGGDLLMLGLTLLGGLLLWAPLLSSRLPLWAQTGYLFLMTLGNVSLMLVFSHLVWPSADSMGMESTLAIALYKAGWLAQLLVLGIDRVHQWWREESNGLPQAG